MVKVYISLTSFLLALVSLALGLNLQFREEGINIIVQTIIVIDAFIIGFNSYYLFMWGD